MQPYDYIIGDCIGMESCFDRSRDFDDLMNHPATSFRKRNIDSRRRGTEERREFPPPIPLLARTENLSSHMPWVLRRHYSGDGRLVLWEERVKRHEYFRAHRVNGRLTLQLVVPLADSDDLDSDGEDGSERGDGDADEEEKGIMSVMEEAAAVENGQGTGKCFSYDSGCFTRVPVPAIRTLLT